MDLLHKKCEVCGTKISKIKKNWYRLFFTNEIFCPNCKQYYRLSQLFNFWFNVVTLGMGVFLGMGIILVILGTIFDSFDLEIWISALMLYLIIKFLIILMVPLELVENKKYYEDDLLHKKCEICETKISKLKNWYRLLVYEIKCPKCKRKYQVPKWFEHGFDTVFLGIGGFIIGTLLIAYGIGAIFNMKKLNWEIFLLAWIIYLIIKFLITLMVPLELTEEKQKKDNDKNE